jgi:myo-inositol-1(or 4)-monophosphatase
MDQVGQALDLNELTQFATDTIREIGQASLNYYGQGRRRPPFDQDLVTRAELTLNESFNKKIESRFPNHQIYGQSTLDEGYTHDAQRFLWVFDPLDGVDNFQIGIPIWGMSLALYENHWPVLGLFFMPATNDLFHALPGKGAYWNDNPIRIADRGGFSQESLLLTYSRFHQHYDFRFPGKARSFGSTGAHVCYVAMGRADAALTASETFKDLAAVRVIVEAAGGKLYNFLGSDFFLGDYVDGRRFEDHVLVTGSASIDMMRECLKRK